jgi:hypothetical protein
MSLWKKWKGILVLVLVGMLALTAASFKANAVRLDLSLNKIDLAFGDSVIITISYADEQCKWHGHRVDLYIYHESGHLESRQIFTTPYQYTIPIEVTYTPKKLGKYTVKLWVMHYPPSRYASLDDKASFNVYVHPQTVTTDLTTTTGSQIVTTDTTKTISVTTTVREIVSTTIQTTMTMEPAWWIYKSYLRYLPYIVILFLLAVLMMLIFKIIITLSESRMEPTKRRKKRNRKS